MSAAGVSFRSFLDGALWPAVPSQRGASVMALLFQFEETQWWTPERLLERQLRQLEALLRHAWESVPYYRMRLGAANYRPGSALTLSLWRELPLLTRRDVQSWGRSLASLRPPPEWGPVVEARTSGATGEPVNVRGTQLDSLMWEAMAMRDHLWHGRDFSAKLAVIRPIAGAQSSLPRATIDMDWGTPASTLFDTGPMATLSLGTDIAAQAEWLKRRDPHYLLTFPNNLQALIRHFAARGERPRSLRAVRTVSETVTAGLRRECLEQWNVPITDCYSSQELGYIALQCPQREAYHVMAESVFVEILAADGRPCEPGETGRLVVTSLHNFAMPLIRYEVRDYAEVGRPCPCGRGLPAIARILGRSRNMVERDITEGLDQLLDVSLIGYQLMIPSLPFSPQLVYHQG